MVDEYELEDLIAKCGHQCISYDDKIKHEHMCKKCHGFWQKQIHKWALNDLQEMNIQSKSKEAKLYIAIYDRHLYDAIGGMVALLVFLGRIYTAWEWEILGIYFPYSGIMDSPGIPFHWWPTWTPNFFELEKWDGNFDAFLIIIVSAYFAYKKLELFNKFDVLIKKAFIEFITGHE